MREIIETPVNEVKPTEHAVLETQGIPRGAELTEKVKAVLEKAMDLYLELSRPRAVIADISVQEFDVVYRGKGLNEKESRRPDSLRRYDRGEDHGED